MHERFDLEKMLRAIQDDKAIDIAQTKHLSQDQIKELVKRREAPSVKQAFQSTEAE